MPHLSGARRFSSLWHGGMTRGYSQAVRFRID